MNTDIAIYTNLSINMGGRLVDLYMSFKWPRGLMFNPHRTHSKDKSQRP